MTDQSASHNEPMYLAAARELSELLGISSDDLLADRQAYDTPYPGPECLRPEEVADYQAGHPIGPERVNHAGSCPYCGPLLEVSAPNRPFREAFLNEIEHLAESERPRQAAVAREPAWHSWLVPGLSLSTLALLILNVSTVVRYRGVADQVASLRGSVELLSRESVARTPSAVSDKPPLANNLDTDAVARNIAAKLEPKMRKLLEQQKKSDREETIRIVDSTVGAQLASLQSIVFAAVTQDNGALKEIPRNRYGAHDSVLFWNTAVPLKEKDEEYNFAPSWNAVNRSLYWLLDSNPAVAAPHSLQPHVQIPPVSPAPTGPERKP